MAPGPAVFQSRDTTRTKVGQRLSAGGLLGRSSDGERGDRGEDEERENMDVVELLFSLSI